MSTVSGTSGSQVSEVYELVQQAREWKKKNPNGNIKKDFKPTVQSDGDTQDSATSHLAPKKQKRSLMRGVSKALGQLVWLPFALAHVLVFGIALRPFFAVWNGGLRSMAFVACVVNAAVLCTAVIAAMAYFGAVQMGLIQDISLGDLAGMLLQACWYTVTYVATIAWYAAVRAAHASLEHALSRVVALM